MFFWIDPGGDEGRGDLTRISRKLGRSAPDFHRLGQGVQIDHAIDAIMRLLHFDEIDDRAEIVAEMQITRRLDARENPFNHGHGLRSNHVSLAPSFATPVSRAQVAGWRLSNGVHRLAPACDGK